MRRRTSAIGIGLILLALAAGCGGKKFERKPVHPVTGRVTFQGKAATGALVVLHPLDDASLEGWPTGYPHGTVGTDGAFAIGTYEEADGAPVGRYTVVIEWYEESSPESEKRGPDRLKGRFGPKTSKLPPAQIKEGPNSLGPFEVK